MLTDTAIKAAKGRDKPYKLSDERGLFLLVTPQSQKWWRLKHRFEGKEKSLSLGVYPEVGLKLARERRDEARQLLLRGTYPSSRRQAEKISQADTFEGLGR